MSSSSRTSGKAESVGLSRISIVMTFFAAWVLTFTVAVWALSGPAEAQDSAVANLAFNQEDIDFILKQIKIAERHAAGEELIDILPNASLPWGLRTVDGSFNNLIPGQETFGQADLEFPNAVGRDFPEAQSFDAPMPFAAGDVQGAPTSYTQGDGRTVQDSTPRLISHLTVNQSVDNPAASSQRPETTPPHCSRRTSPVSTSC